MKATTQVPMQELISLGAEAIYRIANFAPEDRDRELTDMDKPGLVETEKALTALLKEQDKRTRHACAEAVSNVPLIPAYPNVSTAILLDAHTACLNVQAL